jgi:hypothetical protein
MFKKIRWMVVIKGFCLKLNNIGSHSKIAAHNFLKGGHLVRVEMESSNSHHLPRGTCPLYGPHLFFSINLVRLHFVRLG